MDPTKATVTTNDKRQDERRQGRDLPAHIYRHKGRKSVFAQIALDGRFVYLGSFRSVAEATRVIAEAKAKGRRP
jgi:hypothetical protein